MLVNNVYKNKQDEVFRILWISKEINQAVYIRIDNNTSVPEFYDYDLLLSDIEFGILVEVQDPYNLNFINREISKKQEIKREKIWDLISEGITKIPQVFYKKDRSELINDLAGKNNISKRSIYNYFRLYWQRGMCKNALLPDYHKCGAYGQEKTGDKCKRGRPQKYSQKSGCILQEKDKKNIKKILNKYFLKPKKVSLSWTYKRLISECYSRFNINTGEYITNDSYPSETQFRYWTNKFVNNKEKIIKRQGLLSYEKDKSFVFSSSASQVYGPGAIYEIDATIADVYLISRLRKNEIVGRPTIYFITDVFSRMITGFYVGFENASWQTACLALVNTIQNKVEFCSKLGRPINHDMWPCEGLPSKVLGDGAEMKSYNSDNLSNYYGIEIMNAAPYRADWKGTVEKKFDIIQQQFKPYTESYVPKDHVPRVDKDYRLKANLDIEQFNLIILELVLTY